MFDRTTEASTALERTLREHPDALVAALGSDGQMTPIPSSVPRCGQRVFPGETGLDVVAPEDHLSVIEGWQRAKLEPVVRLDLRLLAHPDRTSPVTFFDVRAEHGVHLIVLHDDDPDLVIATAEARAARRVGVARVKRDAVAVFLDVDDTITQLLGWTRDDLIGRGTITLVHPDDAERAIDAWMSMRLGTGASRTRLRLQHADGRYVWVEVTNDNQLDDPEVGCVLSEIVDISAEMARLEALDQRERLLGRLAESLPIGVCQLRADQAIVFSNPPLVDLLGPVDSVDALILSVAGPDRRPLQLALDAGFAGQPSDLEVSVIRGFEECRYELTLRPLTNDDGSIDGLIVCAADVTDRSRLRTELEHRASHDALSGCLNRAAILTALERALRESRQIIVAYVDLDHFKATNDAYGHAAGDELLRVTAARMRGVTRMQDRIGRMGGDEFVVISHRGAGPFEANELVDRLRTAINGDVTFANQRIPLAASVGAALSLEGETDADALLARADAAMYADKRRQQPPAGKLSAVRLADGTGQR